MFFLLILIWYATIDIWNADFLKCMFYILLLNVKFYIQHHIQHLLLYGRSLITASHACLHPVFLTLSLSQHPPKPSVPVDSIVLAQSNIGSNFFSFCLRLLRSLSSPILTSTMVETGHLCVKRHASRISPGFANSQICWLWTNATSIRHPKTTSRRSAIVNDTWKGYIFQTVM